MLGEHAKLARALRGERVRLQVGIDALHANQLGVHELEGLEQPARGLLGGVEEGDGGLVGRGFLVLPVGKHHAHRGVGSAVGCAHAELPEIAGADSSACRHGGEAEQLEHQAPPTSPARSGSAAWRDGRR